MEKKARAMQRVWEKQNVCMLARVVKSAGIIKIVQY
jgi:hypothetical protein